MSKIIIKVYNTYIIDDVNINRRVKETHEVQISVLLTDYHIWSKSTNTLRLIVSSLVKQFI